MSKNYVSMEQKQCPVCGVVFDSGAILMDMTLAETFERNTVTGYKMCEEHERLKDEGYIAVIEAIPEGASVAKTKIDEANRTGRILHIRQEAFHRMFNVAETSPIVFMGVEMFQKLVDMASDAAAT